ncbi:hypothetical protein [Corynebacterium cystitidis]|uniref:Uncharacterized protein n=1 Tax=Corynebacterium cystitidis DSM 20524 TaxID=1121357 RepID=A0A1H9RUM6_9CORY|nr:hypothetical protein [Corynebacterium cystitidis]WJY82089.1 hypothetical protein CCYS_05765 [Corynebacterium cystitidis DSM 20524]SER76502.1 hypothetical protein SAMN05661109_00928 [Corynebacterium cystitidis DSM 20524]SNV79593.1 hypothetical membrane protein [Corynebacterium cystitidis]
MRSSSRSVYRTDFTQGERVTAYGWLALGAAFSALMSLVYLDAQVGSVPFPYPIVLAFLFNLVLTRTALLWTDRRWVALLPVVCWVLVLFLLVFGVSMFGEVFFADEIRALVLVLSGLIGGLFPALRSQ